MTKPKYILFDFWNTLMHSTMDRERGIRGLLEIADNPRNVTVDEIKLAVGELIAATKQLRNETTMEFSREWFDRNLTTRLGLSFDLSNKELDLEFVKNTLDHEIEAGIRDVLELLKKNGIKAGIVSNSVLSGTALNYILEQHSMQDSFEFLMTSTDYGFRKPHPQIFITAQAKTNCQAGETWFAGDWIPQDIVGANEAGMFSVWYNPKGRDSEGVIPGVEIRHWDEFAALLEAAD